MPTTNSQDQLALQEEQERLNQHKGIPPTQLQPNPYDDYINKTAANNNAYEQAVAADVARQREELNKAEAQNREATRLESNKSIYGAATEFAGALANLWGTTKGAANQQPKIYSADWMQQADANRRERQKRVANIRERQRAAELQLAQLKIGNANALEQMRMDNQLRQENRVLQQQHLALQAQDQQFNQQQKIADFAFKVEENNNKNAMDKQKLDAEMAARGFRPNNKGGYDYDETLAAKLAQSKYTASYGVKGRTGGGSNMTFNLAAYGDLPSETITISDTALKNTLLANVYAIDDLDQNDADKLELMVKGRDYDENDLKPYLLKSAKLRDLVRQTAAVDNDPTGGLGGFYGG